MGEFEEVGNTVKSFASDNATVVVGTVIDPSMEGEVRVTVVATGIGIDVPKARGDEREKAAPAVATAMPATSRDAIERERDAAPVQTAKTVEPEAVDYGKFERPTVIRNRRDLDEHLNNPRSDYLDIPAFLRRQAD